jgi:hypothetical protein
MKPLFRSERNSILGLLSQRSGQLKIVFDSCGDLLFDTFECFFVAILSKIQDQPFHNEMVIRTIMEFFYAKSIALILSISTGCTGTPLIWTKQ